MRNIAQIILTFRTEYLTRLSISIDLRNIINISYGNLKLLSNHFR